MRRYITLFVLGLLLPGQSYGGGVVSSATESSLDAALSGGGLVTFSVDGTITLTGTKTIAKDTTIDATGRTITLSGGNSVRLFNVSPGVKLTLRNLTVSGGLNQGSNGSNGQNSPNPFTSPSGGGGGGL
ncbi:MAG: hypothetical protein AB1705_24075, partial [Verrucomicrobiota bacterium]